MCGCPPPVDHDEIRRWIQRHHGAPAGVLDPASVRSAEVLLVDFLGARSGHCSSTFRGEWFAGFDDHRVCLRCPDDPESLLFHLIPRGALPPTVHAINLSP